MAMGHVQDVFSFLPNRVLYWDGHIMTPLVTAWSWSRYADYDQCPLMFKLKHIDRRPSPGSAAMDRGNTIHKLAEKYTDGTIKKLPGELANFKTEFAQLKTLSPMVEQMWGFRNDWSWIGRSGWFGDDVWFRAKADVFILYDDSTAEVIDHKTGKKYGHNEDQVGLFAAAGLRRHPGVTHITARLWYLDISDPKEKEDIYEYTAAEIALIERDWTKKVRPMFSDRKFPPRPSQRCAWCNFSRAKGGPCKF